MNFFIRGTNFKNRYINVLIKPCLNNIGIKLLKLVIATLKVDFLKIVVVNFLFSLQILTSKYKKLLFLNSKSGFDVRIAANLSKFVYKSKVIKYHQHIFCKLSVKVLQGILKARKTFP